MIAWATAALLAAGALFDAWEIPLGPGESVQVTLADLDGSGNGGLAVARPGRLEVYPGARPDQRAETVFPPNTVAFDIADFNGDGRPEVLALTPDRLYSAAVPQPGQAAPPWEERFAVSAQDIAQPPVPVPAALVIQPAGQPALLAVPFGDHLRLYRRDGAVARTYPTGPGAPVTLSIGEDFLAVSAWPPQRGTDALEWRISQHWTGVPALPEDIPTRRPVNLPNREQLISLARYADMERPDLWPGFPLRDAGRPDQAQFCYTRDGTLDSLVRVRRMPPESGREATPRVSTARRYPGRVIPPGETPLDVNHDGWADLLLWNAEQPTYTVGTVMRAATRKTWPARVAVHLFDPERNAFSATPFWSVPLEVPLWWMADALADRIPVRHLMCADFNGDGRVDIGFSDAPNQYRIWCSSPIGLRAEPAESPVFSGPLEELLYAADLDRNGRTSLVFRSREHLAILRAR